jgi:hypothetical protein
MFDNFSLMRTQKINDINELLKIYDVNDILIQRKLSGTLGIFYKTDNKTYFKTRIGISFKNIPDMHEDIPNNTAYLSIISQDNVIAIIDSLVYDEETIYIKPLRERIEYINKHKETLNVQEFIQLEDSTDINNFIIKPCESTYKISKQNSSEYFGDWFTLNDNRHDVIIKSYFINNSQTYFRCFQLIGGNLKKVCNITIEDENINRKVLYTLKNNKRAVVTISGKIDGDKITSPTFIKLKKNKPFNSVTSNNDRQFTTLEIITIGKRTKKKVISNTVDSFSTQRRIV